MRKYYWHTWFIAQRYPVNWGSYIYLLTWSFLSWSEFRECFFSLSGYLRNRCSQGSLGYYPYGWQFYQHRQSCHVGQKCLRQHRQVLTVPADRQLCGCNGCFLWSLYHKCELVHYSSLIRERTLIHKLLCLYKKLIKHRYVVCFNSQLKTGFFLESYDHKSKVL